MEKFVCPFGRPAIIGLSLQKVYYTSGRIFFFGCSKIKIRRRIRYGRVAGEIGFFITLIDFEPAVVAGRGVKPPRKDSDDGVGVGEIIFPERFFSDKMYGSEYEL